MSAERSSDPGEERASGADAEVEKEQGFLSHLVELRDRLLRMFLSVLICFLALFPFANTIYSWMATPLLRHLPEGSSMIAIEVASPFLIPLKVVLMVSVFICIPYIFYQLWAFVAPGLYLHERRLVLPLLVSSTILFFLGVAFAFFVVFPLAFAFLTGFTPDGVQMMTDIGKYLDFVITIFFAFGIAFEVPVATVLLVLIGATTPDDLAKKRPYIIVGAFVVGMLLTPPDIISQTLLAIPMWALFEIGVIASRSMLRRKREAAAAAEAKAGPPRPTPTPAAAAASGAAAASASASSGGDSVGAAEVGTLEAYAGPAVADDAEGAGPGTDATGTDATGDDDYEPMSDEEMERELDRIEAEEAAGDAAARDGAGPEVEEDEAKDDEAKDDEAGERPPSAGEGAVGAPLETLDGSRWEPDDSVYDDEEDAPEDRTEQPGDSPPRKPKPGE